MKKKTRDAHKRQRLTMHQHRAWIASMYEKAKREKFCPEFKKKTYPIATFSCRYQFSPKQLEHFTEYEEEIAVHNIAKSLYEHGLIQKRKISMDSGIYGDTYEYKLEVVDKRGEQMDMILKEVSE